MNNIDEIKEEVRKKLKRDIENLLENYVDNLANKVASEIPNYNIDWCAEDPFDGGAGKYSQDAYEHIEAMVKDELAILFVYANE